MPLSGDTAGRVRPVLVRYLHYALAGIVLATSLAGCNIDAEETILMAAGSYGDVAIVLSDDSMRGVVGDFVDRLGAPLTYVIRDEKPFDIDLFDPGRRELARRWKNIIFIVDWNDRGGVVDDVRKLLSDESLAKLQAGGGGIAQLRDPYARYQYAIFVAGSDRNTIASLLRRNYDEILASLQKENRERIRRKFRHDGIRDELLGSYWKHFGFMIEIPRVYEENQVLPDGFQGVEWMQRQPARGLTLAWREVDDPEASLEDRAALLDLRAELGARMHDEDVVEQSLVWDTIRFGTEDLVRLQGAWTSRDMSFGGGGPFECVFIADPGRGRLFCLDMLVYAPNVDKRVHFRELESIAESFTLKGPSN